MKAKCGLGLRKEHLDDILNLEFKPGFWEITPENWIFMPYFHRDKFEKIISQTLTVAHGVTLSIGSSQAPTKQYLKRLKDFLDRYNIKYFSDHISFSVMDSHHTHELLPLPLTFDTLDMLCERVDYVQNILKRNLILENATYYYVQEAQMSETDFINELAKKSGAKILLDVNNVYVNSQNHNFNPDDFLDQVNLENVAYIHIAGHVDDPRLGMLIDTHGEKVCHEVWRLLESVLKRKKIPCMIERDGNIPEFSELLAEYNYMSEIYQNA